MALRARTPTRPRVLLAAAAVAAPALVLVLVLVLGDDGPDLAGEERDVAAVVDRLEALGEAGRAGAICEELFSRGLRTRLRRASIDCDAQLTRGLRRTREFGLDVEDVTVRGSRATVVLERPEDDEAETSRLLFVREGGRWKVAELVG